MSLYEVTVTGITQSQQSIWRTNWRHIDPDPFGNLPAYRLLQALGFDESDPTAPLADSVFAGFVECATTSSAVQSLFARNIFDPLDFYEIPLGAFWQGLQTGTGLMPPFVCGQWRSNRTNLLVRRGHFSTWGITEDAVDNGSVIVGSALIAAMDDLAEKMSEVVQHMVGLQQYDYRSCVLSKERYMVEGSGTDPITNPARWAYKYYPTEEEQLEHAAFGLTWTRMPNVSSRNSRKVGRGK